MPKNFFVVLLLWGATVQSQIKICSWNLENFGKSKSDSTIVFIANIIKIYDIIAIQEVVAGYGGAQAIAKLADELNRKGSKWDYTISDPTTSSAYKTERYAFIWKTSIVKKKGDALLEQKFNLEIDREPYFCTFQFKLKQFTLVNFHAITKSKQPETEIKYFKFLPQEYSSQNLIFMGDFNCPQSHTVFIPLKKLEFESVFKNQKTSLKQKCNDNQCLASEFDNIWYNTKRIKINSYGIISFYSSFLTLKEARNISDHIPIWAELQILQLY